jgi:diguanylate cyclase (GGDEF)-like protein
MKNWRLRYQLLVLALAPAVLVAIALDAYFVISGLGALDAELRGRGLATVRYLAPASEYGVLSGNRDSLQPIVQAAMSEPDAQAVLITDANGRILASGGRRTRNGSVVLQADGVSEGNGWLGFSAPIRRSGVDGLALEDLFGGPDEAAMHGAAVIGRVYVELGTAALQARRDRLLLTGLAILFAGLLGGALLALRIARSVSRPLMKLSSAVEAMADGQLDVRVSEHSGGELAVLERGFNQMAARLEDAHLNLQERIEHATAQLAHQARHDSLTGLVNRREFESRVEHAIAVARAGETEHALCYLDLDQFKIVNDTSGHAAGDELLRQITHLLRTRVRGEDTLARLGGDEFGVLLEDCRLDDALRVAEALRRMVEEFRFTWQGRVFVVGVSIGLVLITRASKSLSEVLSAADQACYAAKDKGRNRIQLYQADDRELVERRGEMNWAARIAQALEENRLLLYAQPVVPLSAPASEEQHVELLLRMLDEEGNIIPPRAFLAAAERYDQMPTIDRWVVSAACAGIRRYLDRYPDRQVVAAVNISAQSVDRGTMLPWIADQIAAARIPPESLCIEISEAVASLNFAETMNFVQGLRLVGCRFSFDNFGCGMASFSYLKNLPPDFIKIDGSIVREIAESNLSRTMVRAINEMAGHLGVLAIGEAVDSPQVLAALREQGVLWGQGHWFERPRPFNEWLEQAPPPPEPPIEGEARVLSFPGGKGETRS